MRFMHWSQFDYEAADADLVEEICQVIVERANAHKEGGALDDDDDELFEEG